jgi:hypothetical protein
MIGVALAVAPPLYNSDYQIIPSARLLGEISNEPAGGILVWWAGAGQLRSYTITNCIQTSYVGRIWEFEGLYQNQQTGVTDAMLGSGKVAEYPAGSGNYYNYSSGIWFGAQYPREIDGTDTTWFPSVTQSGPYSDIGAMAVPEMEDGGGLGNLKYYGMYFSNSIIPEGMDGENDRLFAVNGQTPKSYQVYWPFADVALNSKRAEDLDPAQGDIVSHEDTYAVGGDWIDASQATAFWIRDTVFPTGDTVGTYNVHGLGIRIEQRTYSWNNTDLENAIVFNYKIRNMNDYPLKAPYMGFFMDNDLGSGGSAPGDDGAWDDLVGFDNGRDIVYAYDENGSESGWDPAPGYLGVVFLDTPGDLGLTGFKAWQYDTVDVSDSVYSYFDGYRREELQYEALATTTFTPWTDPTDIRMLVNTGPYPTMEPEDEYDYTFAIVAGDDLSDLQANVDAVKAAFSGGFAWVAVEEDDVPVSEHLRLRMVSANVVSSDAIINYSLPQAADMNVSVFDASGRKVSTLISGHQPAGASEITWNASAVPAGVYFIRLESNGQSLKNRVLVIH